MDTISRWLFGLLIVAIALERGFEVWLSRRNRDRVLARGGIEYGAEHFPWMVLLHTSFLVAAVAEVWYLERPWIRSLSLTALVSLTLSMTLRYWAVTTLGDRWNTRVLCEPGAPAINTGPYRWLRHPNYLAVVIELLALPLVHTAWLTAIVFSLLNAWMLRVRITIEERALRQHCDYDLQFAGQAVAEAGALRPSRRQERG